MIGQSQSIHIYHVVTINIVVVVVVVVVITIFDITIIIIIINMTWCTLSTPSFEFIPVAILYGASMLCSSIIDYNIITIVFVLILLKDLNFFN